MIRPRSHKLLVGMAALVGAGLALQACSSSSSSSSSHAVSSSAPFRVYALEALSGPLASQGQAELQGVEAAVAAMNQQGGIDGHHVVLSSANDDGDPTTDVTLITGQVDSSTPPNLVVAGTDGSDTDAVTPILKDHDILSVEPTAAVRSSNPSYAPDNYFSINAGAAANTVECEGLHAKGVKSVGLLYPNDALGSIVTSSFEPCFKQYGIKVTAASYPSGGTSFVPELSALKAANPQVLVTSGIGADAATIVTSRAQLAWTIPTYGDLPFSGSPIATLVPAADLKNLYLFQFSSGVYQSSQEKAPEFKTFYNALIKITGTKALPTPIATYGVGYDAVADVAMAAAQAHSITTSALLSAMAHMKPSDPQLNVTFHPLAFSPTDHSEVPGANGFEFIPADTPLSDGIFGLAPGTSPSF
jgi:branched-chain amino acid transport system substrate-binding protein